MSTKALEAKLKELWGQEVGAEQPDQIDLTDVVGFGLRSWGLNKLLWGILRALTQTQASMKKKLHAWLAGRNRLQFTASQCSVYAQRERESKLVRVFLGWLQLTPVTTSYTVFPAFSPRSCLSHRKLRDRRQLMSTKALVTKKQLTPVTSSFLHLLQLPSLPAF